MSRPVLVIRPEPGNGETTARATAMGLNAIACPLAHIEPLDWIVPDPAAFDSLLLTSANAVRAAGSRLEALSALPVWAVGERSARAARAAGLQVAQTGSGGIAELLAGATPARLLHLCGEDRVSPPHGWAINAMPVYANRLMAAPNRLASLLAEDPVVLLHSARMAAHFADLCECRSRIALVAISDAVGRAAGSGWQRVAVAAQSSDEAMLELARTLVASENH